MSKKTRAPEAVKNRVQSKAKDSWMSSYGSSYPGSGSSTYAETRQAHGTIRATALEAVDMLFLSLIHISEPTRR
eukprot:8647681-Lingulodinium_polyedra.AAC.1